jgi:hypothetical protein
MIETSGLFSGFETFFVVLPTALDSVFLFVTGAFNCAETDFAAVLDMDFSTGFAADLESVFGVALAAILESTLAIVFDNVLCGDFPAAVLGATFVLPFDLALTVFIAGFAATLEDVNLDEAGFAFFAEDVWIFADFFIAFAMGSTTK